MGKVLIVFMFVSLFVFASSAARADQADDIACLKNRVQEIENQMQAKIEYCEMRFRPYGTYVNNCPGNTFINRVFLLNTSGPIQVSCGYYRLQCFRKLPDGKVVSEEIPLRMDDPEL